MKFENQLFHFFFYPFLIGVILSFIIICFCFVYFSNDYIDKETGDNLVNFGKEYLKININSINNLVTTNLLKMQICLNELIAFYEKMAKQLKSGNPGINRKINDEYFKCVLDLDENMSEEDEESLYIAYWFIDLTIRQKNLVPNSMLENQLIAFSNILPSLFATFYSTNSTSKNFYFYFESTDVFISFPLVYDYQNGFMSEIADFQDNEVWCTDENGDIYTVYKVRCRGWYGNIKKAKTNVFDFNIKDNENRTIFVTEFYAQVGTELEIIFSICIEFVDPISNKLGYMCSDVESSNLNHYFDKINSKLSGYFFIIPVGFSHTFYFPDGSEEGLTLSEHIFKNENEFYLEEKIYFINYIQRLMSSNYIKYLSNDYLYNEVFINGENSYDQIFYLNGKVFNYTIYPVVLENIKGEKEHVLNLIYIYNNGLLYDQIKIKAGYTINIILLIIIYIIFGSGLLYLIILSLNILSKYIVIPIKNVNYMLKGINIGGENRLDYLNLLKKRQDDNAEMLEQNILNDYNKNLKDNNNELGNNYKDENNEKNKEKNNNQKEENIENYSILDNMGTMDPEQIKSMNFGDVDNKNVIFNPNINYYNKFEEENDYIEKETNFYDFDQELLRFRPLEIEHLIKILIDIKGALSLTSNDQNVDQIINYSNSEDTFRNCNNKEGTTICQSNIGNLQSQLFKYDKAIYHLAISLQDNRLKKFLNKALSDEFDESDNLLNNISMSFHINREKRKNNKIVEKQLNNAKNNYSKKVIGILINSRYSKLIKVYYKFFSLILKQKIKALSGLFMNTIFHDINYYHKIIIQYIYLCFVKNDLTKTGESILDYIEFLIKFKFKTSLENRDALDIKNKNNPELRRKQQFKKYIYDKILNWFNLFDEYTLYVRNNTSLNDDKNLIEDFSLNLNNIEFNSGSQSLFLFKVNLQRLEFLKGKFALICNNYTDALFFFIRAAKKNSIVLDGLIKKKSLMKIHKILIIFFNKYKNYGIINSIMKEKISELEKVKITKIHSFSKKLSKILKLQDIKKNKNTFQKEMDFINKDIIKALEECNAKQKKDIVFIIDFNMYNKEQNIKYHNDKIDSFVDQIRMILDNYLSIYDRVGIIIYKIKYQIICPLLEQNGIDKESLIKDLINYKNNLCNEFEENEDSSINELNDNNLDIIPIRIQYGKQNRSESDSQDSFNREDKQIKSEDESIKGLVESINYSRKYLKMKDKIKNEKMIILFTDIFNSYGVNDEIITSNFNKIDNEINEISFILIGKIKEKDKKINHLN